jgi:HPt (histidine-containing phosphotransfer) domain-containing protein
MNKRHSGRASVATYANHEVITPPARLRKAIVEAVDDGDDPVARAELALAALGGEFATWMTAEYHRLDAIRQSVRETGLAESSLRELFRVAHDIKGEALTFGFPAIAPIAASLCRLLEQAPGRNRIPLVLIEQHIDAIGAALREHGTAGYEEVASALTTRLRNVTEGFLGSDPGDQTDQPGQALVPPPMEK